MRGGDCMVNLSRMRTLIGYERRLKLRYMKKLSDATKITTQLTGMPRGSGNHSQVESGAIELAEVEEAYKEVFEELGQMRIELAPLIDTLDNDDDRGVLRLRYIDGWDLQQIPEAVCLSERAMFYHLAGGERKLMRTYPESVCK